MSVIGEVQPVSQPQYTYTCRLKTNTMPPKKVLLYLLVVFIKGFVTVNDVPGHLLFAVI